MTKTLSPELQKKKLSEKYRGVFRFEFDEPTNENEAAVSIPDTIHLIPIGQWEHDLYGPILITAADIREFAQNFNAKIRKGVPITAGHEGFAELPATGWISQVEARDNGLWGMVEWNDIGKEALSDKQYKFFSPEFYRDYEDPETHQLYRNVITGGALTKSPYFKELEAIVFSEPKLIKKFSNNEKDTMDLATILAKPIESLDDAEKAFIKEHKAELTPEQLTSHTAIVDEAKAETDEEKTAREEKEKGDANEAAGLNRDGSAKEQVQASEKVQISAAELAILRSQADEGAKAFAELKKAKLSESVKALTFSNTNKSGKFLPKSTDTLRAFIETLNDAQHAKFTALIAELPTQVQFAEIGTGAGTEGTAKAEVDAKIEQKLTAAEKAGKPMKYSEALKEVMSENEGLEERFDSELVPVRAASKN